MDSITEPEYRSISHHDIAEVRQRVSSGQQALFTLRPFKKEELISLFSAGTISAKPTYLTVQIEKEKHITLKPEFLQYINHSCEPNCFFDTTTMKLIAIRDVKAGEELTFFYPSTEWIMDQPFQCYCGKLQCLGEIRGAAFLPEEVLKRYRLTDFIQKQLAKRSSRKVRA